jgi:hypothetical protein
VQGGDKVLNTQITYKYVGSGVYRERPLPPPPSPRPLRNLATLSVNLLDGQLREPRPRHGWTCVGSRLWPLRRGKRDYICFLLQGLGRCSGTAFMVSSCESLPLLHI